MEVKWVREKIQRTVNQSQTMGEEGTCHSSRVVVLQHHTDTDPWREQTALQCPHAYILAHSLVMAVSSLSLFFFPFSALPVVEGVGVTLTQFCHGRSHYHSDHFSLTHCKLQAG